METVVLGGGCFWCIEAVYQRIGGVKRVISGYAGGDTNNPTYGEVSTGETGHAEVVKVEFNPDEIKLEEILKKFFLVHEPTSLNRQGADVGTQYRSIILYTDRKQKDIIDGVIDEIKDQYTNPIITEVKKLENFYKAEDYHQDYYNKNPNAGYCRLVIKPKLEKTK